jgi:hypothetical protein
LLQLTNIKSKGLHEDKHHNFKNFLIFQNSKTFLERVMKKEYASHTCMWVFVKGVYVLEREKDRDILQSTVVVLISYGTKKKHTKERVNPP